MSGDVLLLDQLYDLLVDELGRPVLAGLQDLQAFRHLARNPLVLLRASQLSDFQR